MSLDFVFNCPFGKKIIARTYLPAQSLFNTPRHVCERVSYLEPVWTDLAKYRYLGKLSKIFGKYLRVYFMFEKNLNLLC